jgi:hypothetical protein
MKRDRIEVDRAEGVTSWALSRMVAQLIDLRGAKKAVLRVLADHYPNIWPKIQTIADEAGYGTSQTRVVIGELEAEAYIRCLTDKRGGVSRPAQYEINVAKIKAMLEQQTQRSALPLKNETQRWPLPLDSENPTMADENPTVTGANPTVAGSEPNDSRWVNPTMAGVNPTVAVAEHTKNRELQQTIEQRMEERREKATPVPTAGQAVHAPSLSYEDAAGAAAVVVKQNRADSSALDVKQEMEALALELYRCGDNLLLTGKSRVIAEAYLREYPRSAIVAAFSQYYAVLDDWESKQAVRQFFAEEGGRAPILAYLDIQRRREETNRAIAEVKLQLREQAEAEAAEIERREQEENALIEETLGANA